MKNIIEACNNKKLCSSINLVVSNKSDAGGLKIANKYNIETHILDSKNLSNQNFESLLDKILKKIILILFA